MSEEKVEIKKVKLNNGNEIPIVGLGTFGVYILKFEIRIT